MDLTSASKLKRHPGDEIIFKGYNGIDLTAILRGDVNGSYNAVQHNRSAAAAPEPKYAPLPINNDDDLLMLPLDIV